MQNNNSFRRCSSLITFVLWSTMDAWRCVPEANPFKAGFPSSSSQMFGWLNQLRNQRTKKPVRWKLTSSRTLWENFINLHQMKKMSNNFEKTRRNTSINIRVLPGLAENHDWKQPNHQICPGHWAVLTNRVRDASDHKLQRGLGKEKYIKRALVGFTTWYLLLIPFTKSWYLLPFVVFNFFCLFYQLPLLARGQSDSLS